MRPTARAFPVIAALFLGGISNAAAQQSGLPKQSPFLPADAPAAAPANSESYELAAVSTVGKKTTVNVYDKTAKKGRWIAVGESVEGISVVSYDAKRELIVARIAGAEKTLTLRRSGGPNGVAQAGGAQPMFRPAAANPMPAIVPTTVPQTAVPQTAVQGFSVAPAPGTAPLPKQEPPPTPGSVAHQEQEARMLVSDLLEIGMAQRKAYEEAQRKGATGETPANSTSAATPTPAPVPAPGS